MDPQEPIPETPSQAPQAPGSWGGRSTRSAPQGPPATLDDSESLLRNAGSNVQWFRQNLRRLPELRPADTPTTSQENATVEVEEPQTESQPPPSQEI